MNKRTSAVIFLVLFTTFLMSQSWVFAYKDNEHTRSSLQGLKGVCVFVEFSTSEIMDLNKMGLSEEVIKTDVELQLRMAGINVVSKEGVHKLPGLPQLGVTIAGWSGGSKGIAFSINIFLAQYTYLERDPKLKVLANTWERSYIGLGYTDRDIKNQFRNLTKDGVDGFINAYLLVNPKKM